MRSVAAVWVVAAVRLVVAVRAVTAVRLTARAGQAVESGKLVLAVAPRGMVTVATVLMGVLSRPMMEVEVV